jgi:hypothetical protein
MRLMRRHLCKLVAVTGAHILEKWSRPNVRPTEEAARNLRKIVVRCALIGL